MNIIKIQNQLKGVPDDTLVGYVQNPSGQVPTYLALSELQRRKEMRNSYQANKPEEKSVAEDLVQEAQPQMMGVAGLPEAQPMMEAMAPQPEMPMEQMAHGGLAELDTGNMYDENNYATGGIVAFDDGGPVKHYAYGGPSYTDPFKYDPSYYKDAQAALMKPRESIALDDYIINQQAAQRQLGVDPDFYKKTLEESKTERLKELEDAKKMDQAQLLLAYSSALTGTPTFGGALAKGSEKASSIIGSMGKTQREINSMYKMADRKTLEAQQAQARGDASAAMKAVEDRDNINTQIGLKNAELETSVRIAGYKARADKSGKAYEIFDKAKDNAQKEFEKDYPDAARKVEFSGPDGPAKESLVKKQYFEKNLKLLMGDTEGAFGPTSTKPAASTVTQPAATSTVKPIINPDGTVTVPGTGTFRKLPNGNYEKIT
jgi:hypothetical protein